MIVVIWVLGVRLSCKVRLQFEEFVLYIFLDCVVVFVVNVLGD